MAISAEAIRLTVVMTHPIQYYAPWFRHIAAHCPEIDLTVLYATQPTSEQQGVGFGRSFQWDVPLTEGYRCRVLRPARPGESVDSDRFWGLDVPEIGAAIRESRPDVALIAGWHSITLLRALWACRRQGIPVLYRGDTNLGAGAVGWRRSVWKLRTWALLRAFNGYLSVGERASEYLRRFGVSDSRIWRTPHCVDNEFFARSAAPHQSPEGRAAARAAWGLDPGEFVALFVGKLERVKRPLDLIRGAACMEPRPRLLMIGGGALEQECQAEARRLGVGAVWAGFLNQSELGRAYAAADCLVLPGTDTWGLVVNEALATGLPCVVSDRVGCASDLVTPGWTGESFGTGDVHALGAALDRVRASGRAGHEWFAACRERAARHSFERASEGLVMACRQVGARRGRTRDSSRRRTPPRVLACCGGMVIVAGVERMTFEVLRVLRARGAPVHCIVNSWENHRIVALAEEIGASWSTGYYWYHFDRHTRNPLKLMQFAWDITRTSLGLLRDAWRFRPTHVLVPEFISVLRNAPALLLLRMLGTRVVCRVGNAPDPRPFYRRVWRRLVSPMTDQFVCNSRFTMRELLAHDVPRPKVSMIYNCVPRRAGPPAKPAERIAGRIIYVGQVIPPKGLDLLLEAVALLRASGREVSLDVVGDVDGWEPAGWVGYRAEVRARAQRTDLAGRVSFLSWREDVPELLARASVHCCPSRPEIREGFGIVTIEAKQAGIPSVICQSGALPELIDHGVDGWVCSEPTPGAIAEGIEFLLKDPVRLEKAGDAARQSLKRFGRERFADAWRAVFDDGADRG